MAIEVFNGASIPRDLATAGIEYLWSKWRTLNNTNSLNLQRLMEESSQPLRDYCTYVVPAGDDFVYLYIGQALQEAVKHNSTGRLVSRTENSMAKDFVEVYRRAVREMSPLFVRFTSTRSSPGTLWHQVILPVRIHDESVMLVCYSELISHQLEIYEHLFRTARDAMLVASPVTNEAGHVVDGWILMMNDLARQMLNYKRNLGNLRLSALPQFDGIDLWGRIHAPRPTVTTTLVTTQAFDIEILRFPHVFGLRLNLKPTHVADDRVTLAPEMEFPESTTVI
jgi:PAS domain-containing protein